MKKNETNEIKNNDINKTMISGTVTFTKGSEKCLSVGLKCAYYDEYSKKNFTCYPIVKLFANANKDITLTDIEKGDVLTITAHHTTSKFTDKNGNERFTTELVADNFDVVE